MTQLGLVYNELVKHFDKKKDNRRVLKDATHSSHGVNTTCGDDVTVYVKQRFGVIEEVTYDGQGCSLCTSSAAIMTEQVLGKTQHDVEELILEFRSMVVGIGSTKNRYLKAFEHVHKIPVRVKCVILPWHTLAGCFKGAKTVTTDYSDKTAEHIPYLT